MAEAADTSKLNGTIVPFFGALRRCRCQSKMKMSQKSLNISTGLSVLLFGCET